MLPRHRITPMALQTLIETVDRPSRLLVRQLAPDPAGCFDHFLDALCHLYVLGVWMPSPGQWLRAKCEIQRAKRREASAGSGDTEHTRRSGLQSRIGLVLRFRYSVMAPASPFAPIAR